jgi:hypothetical protein
MNELDIWNQGHSAGINLAVKLINQWCDMDCKTLAETIKAINEIKQEEAA